MRIYTGLGDKGFTSVFGGIKLPKDHLLLEGLGSLDELSSLIAVVKSKCNVKEISELLRELQYDLFRVSAEIACLYTPIPGRKCKNIEDNDVKRIEEYIDHFSEKLRPINKFILMSGSELTSYLYYLRSVCRRVERVIVRLFRSENIRGHDVVLSYLNRLSDLIFVLARYSNLIAGGEEEYIEI